MKTLSIRQPWAWLICAGYKNIENRTWATSYRGKLLIHASKSPALDPVDMAEFRRLMLEEADIAIPADLPAGGIVGVVDLVDCTMQPTPEQDPEEWHEPGCYGFVLENARELRFRPMPGKLHLFDVDYAPE